MGEEYRKQHVVCQAYLKRFAVEKDGKYIIGTRLKQNNKRDVKLFSNSVENVAYIEDYYDTLSKSDKKYWEHYLDDSFDTLCGTPLGNIISQITMRLPDEGVVSEADKMILARIIMSQMVRVPSFLDERIEWSEGFLGKRKEELLSMLPISKQQKARLMDVVDFSADARKDMILEGIFDKKRFEKFCTVLVNRVWVVYVNAISNLMPFITSDNPALVKNCILKRTGLNANGIGNDNTVIFYPITPKILIALYSPNLYFGAMTMFDKQRVVIDDIKFIGNINIEIIDNCYRHAFLPAPLYNELMPDDRRIAR